MDYGLSPPLRVWTFTVEGLPGDRTPFVLDCGEIGSLWLPLRGIVHTSEMTIRFGSEGDEMDFMEGMFFHIPSGVRRLVFRRTPFTPGDRQVMIVTGDRSVHIRDGQFL